MDERSVTARGIRYAISEDGKEVARAYLYILRNDLHVRQFGLLEDVYTDPAHKGKGYARTLVRAVITRARDEGCYKLIATSRNDGTREQVHAWYERLGFMDYGTEFRMNFN